MTSFRPVATMLCALASAGVFAVSVPTAPRAQGTPGAAKPAAPPALAPAGPPSTVDVMVSGQGTPVPGVRVTLAPDVGRPPEGWNAGDSKPLAVIPTDASGHAHFANVPPGKWIVTTNCITPDNWISGSYASRLETFAGRPVEATLTMRKGGMIRAKALRGDRPVGQFEVRTDAPDALLSTCPMATTGMIDTTTGAFTVIKIPVNATLTVKAVTDLGAGELSVWRTFSMTKPETLDATLNFPALTSKELGNLVLRFRTDNKAPTDSGKTDLTLIQPDLSWRYETIADIGGRDTVVTLKGLPAGAYQTRSTAYPGQGKWWSAPPDSARVVAGKTSEFIIHARIR